MKENNKCFIKLNNGNYEEITYKELIERRKNLKEYEDKKFIKVDKFLLEVTKDEYKQMDLEEQREKYVRRLKNKIEAISLDKVYADKYTLKDAIPDYNEDLSDIIQRKIENEKMQKALLMLSDNEYRLIKALFYDRETIRQYALKNGIPFMTIQNRKNKILRKLKKFIKN